MSSLGDAYREQHLDCESKGYYDNEGDSEGDSESYGEGILTANQEATGR